MTNIERDYNILISNYIYKRFNNINIIDISYEFNDVTFNVTVEVELNIIDTLKIRIDKNAYGQDEFNKDYIKLKLFHEIKDAILNMYIEGDHNNYE
ncbi:MAG: hypothetical protein U0L18_05300 [Acutalibacteraceae bacterium]|nr:hypothetical protein [Acutalibacteraceae bacterium]